MLVGLSSENNLVCSEEIPLRLEDPSWFVKAERCIYRTSIQITKVLKELYVFSEIFQLIWESTLQRVTGLNFNFNRALKWLQNTWP